MFCCAIRKQLQFSPTLCDGQLINREILCLVMQLQLKSIRQESLEHQPDLVRGGYTLAGCLGLDFVLIPAIRPTRQAQDLVVPDIVCIHNETRESS